MKKYFCVILLGLLLTSCGSKSFPSYSPPIEYTMNNKENDLIVDDSETIEQLEAIETVNQDNLKTANTSTTSDLTIYDELTILVNKQNQLPKDYVPKDLVKPRVQFDIDDNDEKRTLRQEAATALEKMFEAAKEDGLTLYAVSGYRSYNRQKAIYNANLKNKGVAHTEKYSAKPGHSEHQTGLAIDISASSINYKLLEAFAKTPEGKWLKANCATYGFILRYPKDKTDITQYAFEPWHFRYIGVDIATYIMEHNLTLEEFYSLSEAPDMSTAQTIDETVSELEEQALDEVKEATITVETFETDNAEILPSTETKISEEETIPIETETKEIQIPDIQTTSPVMPAGETFITEPALNEPNITYPTKLIP